MNASPPQAQLEELRRLIDSLDDGMLDLLQKRFAAVAVVKALKSNDPVAWPSPLRPAREMQILKRLAGTSDGSVSPELLVRLWRAIVTTSTLVQAPVTVHVPKRLSTQMRQRLMIRDYFGNFDVSECRDEVQALVQVNVEPGHVCVVETSSNWAEAFADGKGGRAQVISTLPALRDGDIPQLLIFGVAPAEPTGDDETLLISKGSLPRDFAVQPLWSAKSGSYRLSALAGFYSEHESPIVSLVRSNPGLGLAVAGRYPSPISM